MRAIVASDCISVTIAFIAVHSYTILNLIIEIYIHRGEIMSFFNMESCGGSQNRAILYVTYNFKAVQSDVH